MKACLETLCVRNGQLQNLPAHNERFGRTRRDLWNLDKPVLLEDTIQLPTWLSPDQTYKCRVTYGPDIQMVEFEEYQVRFVQSLRLIAADDLEYSYKYADRQALNELFAQRGSADDVLLVRDGLLTDTSYANVALFDGLRWVTPARPLLAGTKRAQLLNEGILHTADIQPQGLNQFSQLKLLNAMLDWEHTSPIAIQNIRW